jgi:hypothetical protein
MPKTIHVRTAELTAAELAEGRATLDAAVAAGCVSALFVLGYLASNLESQLEATPDNDRVRRAVGVIRAWAEGQDADLPVVLPLGHLPGVDPWQPQGYCGICCGLWQTDAERDAAHAGTLQPPEPAAGLDPSWTEEDEAAYAAAAVVEEPAAPAVDAERRAMRWQQVAEAVAAGLAEPPREVRISVDGWSLTLVVETPEQVRAWAAALAVGEPEVRVYKQPRGAVVRETYAAIGHPFAVRVACVEAPPVRALAGVAA